MERRPEQQASEDSPLYVRWSPDRSPYAIELRLELVSKILRALEDAEFSGAEIGGVLIGSVSQQGMAVVRIDELELIPRNPEDGAIYMPNRAQLARVAEV